ncbi:MAG: phenylacetate-CoA oxygenase subunit PaaI [Thalassobaculaceae bacterium]|nr:phenylacetate-CoA oxygenase subunit PaaI [Thalassobaculaceae bacterium]
MSDAAALDDYLAQGGKLTAPENAAPRYRGELMRLMAAFVDSEMAGAAGFADGINAAPGLGGRVAAARIVQEKFEHAARVLKIMGEFGADTARYATHQPWAARLGRDADIGTVRRPGDMRLNVFHYPLEGWVDAVMMNVLMGRATVIQLQEFTALSYQPLADAFRAILPREARHAQLGEVGLGSICAEPGGRGQAQAAAGYWMPRVAASFGTPHSARFDTLNRFGLRHETNETLLTRWRTAVSAILAANGLTA